MTTNPEDIATEDLAAAKSSVAISSAHHSDDDGGGDDDDDEMVPLCLEYLNFQLSPICNFNCFLRHLSHWCGNTKKATREMVFTKMFSFRAKNPSIFGRRLTL